MQFYIVGSLKIHKNDQEKLCTSFYFDTKYNNFIRFKHLHVLAHNQLIGIEKCFKVKYF